MSRCPERASATAGSEKDEALVSQETEFSAPFPKTPANPVRAYGGIPSIRKWPRVCSAICRAQNSSATRDTASSHATGARPARRRSSLIFWKTARLTGSLGVVAGGQSSRHCGEPVGACRVSLLESDVDAAKSRDPSQSPATEITSVRAGIPRASFIRVTSLFTPQPLVTCKVFPIPEGGPENG